MFDLNAYQWKNRLLLISAPSEDSLDYQLQMRMLEGQRPKFEDRDLLVVELLEICKSRIATQSIDEATAAKIRSRFNLDPQEFSVILVGKDGTSKRRYVSPVSPGDVFAEIDTMPMRRQEMRSHSG
jgi:hypothetical protein